MPTTYRQVETQYHRPDDKTIIEKKIYKVVCISRMGGISIDHDQRITD